ncbi:PREDICTED: uncharacterized protein LOC105565900 [Vollenhovia emeryi]|uniref:uncharacterized protein LOC105565900 n=1 Tax=Vollenhovia emeryi TaxID=411798 RepID=UPI0005F427CF|nr:PREDICTED: uncharacterized protein LOC105565900 [Vollenhovia emeryi]
MFTSQHDNCHGNWKLKRFYRKIESKDRMSGDPGHLQRAADFIKAFIYIRGRLGTAAPGRLVRGVLEFVEAKAEGHCKQGSSPSKVYGQLRTMASRASEPVLVAIPSIYLYRTYAYLCKCVYSCK